MYVQQQDFKEGAQENKDQPNLGTNGRERYKCNYRAISRKAINYVSNGAEEGGLRKKRTEEEVEEEEVKDD